MKTTIKQVKVGFKLTVKSAIDSIKPLSFVAATREACEAERQGFEALMVEFEADEARKIARARYIRVIDRANALQAAYPGLYLVDECVCIENAADGLRQNAGIDIEGMNECEWPAAAFDAVADNVIAFAAERCAENEIDGREYGFSY